MIVLNLYISVTCAYRRGIRICLEFRYSNFVLMENILYSSREHSTNPTFLCKTNPIFPLFSPKTMIKPKNKPNSNPTQSQFWPKNKGAKPIQSQTNPIQNLSSIGAYLLSCRGAILYSFFCFIKHLKYRKIMLLFISKLKIQMKQKQYLEEKP